MTILDERIKKAQELLISASGEEPSLEGKDSERVLTRAELEDLYKEEATFEIISKQFTEIAQSIRKMRSSFLPVEFFLNNGDQFLTADIAADTAKMESYENAFMRMLGMPSVGTSEFARTAEDAEIRSGQNLKYVDPEVGNILEGDFDFIKENILDQRQRAKQDRRVLISNSIYNIRESDIQSEESPELLTSLDGVTEDTERKEVRIKIDELEDQFWYFSHLLLPPIQDINIAGCINEPEKLVAPPFSNTRARNVNNNKVRPTLLESVIRIRLDRASGTSSFFSGETDPLELNTGNLDTEVQSDDYGLLEALFIVRLSSAIKGLAKKTIADIDQVLAEIEKDLLVPTNIDKQTGSENAGGGSIEAAIPKEDISDQESSDAVDDLIEALDNLSVKAEADFRAQLLIEDSILFLLGDNAEILDLQTQSQRNSTIHTAHMMSGLQTVINVPRDRVQSALIEIEDSRSEHGKNSVDPVANEVNTVLGTDIGIGTIDVAVFSLALFTLSEANILGLLSQAQFDRLKQGEFKPLLPEGTEKVDALAAINALTELIHEGYELFIKTLRDPGR